MDPTIISHSPELDKLFQALCIVQSQLKHAPKSEENPFFKSKYADLPELLDTGRPIASANGIAISQFPTGNGGLTTVIGHESGQYIMSTMYMTLLDNKPQTLGSCLTYARRYAYASVLGIAQDDDDANEASGNLFNMDDSRSIDWLGKVMEMNKIDKKKAAGLARAMHNRPVSDINKVLKKGEK